MTCLVTNCPSRATVSDGASLTCDSYMPYYLTGTYCRAGPWPSACPFRNDSEGMIHPSHRIDPWDPSASPAALCLTCYTARQVPLTQGTFRFPTPRV